MVRNVAPLIRRTARLTNLNFIRNNPNINLPEPFFQGRFEMPEECHVFRRVFHVNEQADIIFFKPLSFVNPDARNVSGKKLTAPN